MTLKDTLGKWHTAICLLENGRVEEAVDQLQQVQKPSAKVVYNLGCAYMIQQSFTEACKYLSSSIEQDKYLAIAFYMRGLCYFHLSRLDRAELDFLTAQSLLPADGIDYRQLGANVLLEHKLLSECVQLTRKSYKEQVSVRLPLLSTLDCLFRPPRKMVANLIKENFLGKAKVISSVEEKDIVYASEKKRSLSPAVGGPPSQSSSLPASPVSPRRQIRESGGRVPPPTRPPPRLTQSPLVGRKNAESPKRSKSSECLFENHGAREDGDRMCRHAEELNERICSRIKNMHLASQIGQADQSARLPHHRQNASSSSPSSSSSTQDPLFGNTRGLNQTPVSNFRGGNNSKPVPALKPVLGAQSRTIVPATDKEPKSVLSRVHPSLLQSSSQTQLAAVNPDAKVVQSNLPYKAASLVPDLRRQNLRVDQPAREVEERAVLSGAQTANKEARSPKPPRPPPPKKN